MLRLEAVVSAVDRLVRTLHDHRENRNVQITRMRSITESAYSRFSGDLTALRLRKTTALPSRSALRSFVVLGILALKSCMNRCRAPVICLTSSRFKHTPTVYRPGVGVVRMRVAGFVDIDKQWGASFWRLLRHLTLRRKGSSARRVKPQSSDRPA